MSFSCPLRAHAKNTEIGPARPEDLKKSDRSTSAIIFGTIFDLRTHQPFGWTQDLRSLFSCRSIDMIVCIHGYSASLCTMLMSNYKHRMLMLQAELLRKHSIHVNMQHLMYLSCTYAQTVHQTYHYICRCFQSMYKEGCAMPMYCESYVLYPNRINLYHFILVYCNWFATSWPPFTSEYLEINNKFKKNSLSLHQRMPFYQSRKHRKQNMKSPHKFQDSKSCYGSDWMMFGIWAACIPQFDATFRHTATVHTTYSKRCLLSLCT